MTKIIIKIKKLGKGYCVARTIEHNHWLFHDRTDYLTTDTLVFGESSRILFASIEEAREAYQEYLDNKKFEEILYERKL